MMAKKRTRRLLLFLWIVLQYGSLPSVRAAQPEATKRLIVVAPEAFHSALKGFAEHKQKLRPTEVLSLERILAETEGVDAPEKLKRFLFQEWKRAGLGYALLVGDVDVLPVRYMVLDRITPAAFDYAFYPSDLYYSDLAKADGSFDDWNSRKEGFHAGYFGEVRGEKNKQGPVNYDEVDYRPDIAVGRWPVSTAEEVRQVAQKTMRFEEQVLGNAAPHLRRAAFIAVGGWVDSRGLLDRLGTKLNPGWQVEKRYYRDKGQTAGPAAPDHEQLRNLLNEGTGLLVHTGHGQPDAWEQCFSVSDLDRITNAVQLPVIISAGCSTAYFAPLPPYGAYVDVNGREHDGTDHKQPDAGWYPPSIFFQGMKFMLFGDPSLRLPEAGEVGR